jgi:hypothetical protein
MWYAGEGFLCIIKEKLKEEVILNTEEEILVFYKLI